MPIGLVVPLRVATFMAALLTTLAEPGAAVAGSTGATPASTAPGITTINGKVPPGRVQAAQVTRLLRVTLESGEVLYQYRTVRPAGTRAPIHRHPYGGSTCVIQGETTMRIEGKPGAITHRAGTCFYMPPGPVMANFNSGTMPFITLDSFILKTGQKPMEVVEPGHAHIEGEFKR